MAKIVDIVVGSEKSDVPLVDNSGALAVLDFCGLEWHLHIISADRNPDDLKDYCRAVSGRNVGVIIAAAGMAAVLPGTIAINLNFEPIIVIGVPLPSKEFPNALDALYTIIRKPSGCSVLVCGTGEAGLKNAAISAVRIIASGEDIVSAAMMRNLKEYLKTQEKLAQFDYRSSKEVQKSE